MTAKDEVSEARFRRWVEEWKERLAPTPADPFFHDLRRAIIAADDAPEFRRAARKAARELGLRIRTGKSDVPPGEGLERVWVFNQRIEHEEDWTPEERAWHEEKNRLAMERMDREGRKLYGRRPRLRAVPDPEPGDG